MAKTESTPRGLQKTFLFTLLVAYLAQAAFSLMSFWQFNVDGINAWALYLNVAQLVLVPLVLVFAAWIISPRKISRLGKVFESTVLAVIGFAAITFFGTVATFLPFGNALYAYPLSPLMVPLLVTAVYIVILLALRATKRWK